MADGETPVGLLAMIDLEKVDSQQSSDDPENAAYIWRLMISADHQGKGYGKAAMDLAFDMARTWGRTVMTLSVVEREGSALPFYQKFGLEPTDRIEDGERILRGPIRPA
ncbi:GNAT family N-acetyltransferase [Halovulum sp. GXIMD14793]